MIPAVRCLDANDVVFSLANVITKNLFGSMDGIIMDAASLVPARGLADILSRPHVIDVCLFLFVYAPNVAGAEICLSNLQPFDCSGCIVHATRLLLTELEISCFPNLKSLTLVSFGWTGVPGLGKWTSPVHSSRIKRKESYPSLAQYTDTHWFGRSYKNVQSSPGQYRPQKKTGAARSFTGVLTHIATMGAFACLLCMFEEPSFQPRHWCRWYLRSPR